MSGPVRGSVSGPDSRSAHPPIPEFTPVADFGVNLVFGDEITDETIARVRALDTALTGSPPLGLVELVPAMTSLLVVFDPLVTDHDAIATSVRACLGAATVNDQGRTHVIDVCYDDPHAPDLERLSGALHIDPAEVIATHLAGVYTVGMYGFAPGYAYLYGVPETIRQPRSAMPGAVVPAGSVIVAGQQCMIIPTAMSTGWFAIGRSPAAVFNPERDRPFLFDVGDRVTFRQVSRNELDQIWRLHPTCPNATH